MRREHLSALTGVVLMAAGITQIAASDGSTSDRLDPRATRTPEKPVATPAGRAVMVPASPEPVQSSVEQASVPARLLGSRTVRLGGKRVRVERFSRSYCVTVDQASPTCGLQQLNAKLALQVYPLDGVLMINSRARVRRLTVKTTRRDRVELVPTDAYGLKLSVLALEPGEDPVAVRGLDKAAALVKLVEIPQIGR